MLQRFVIMGLLMSSCAPTQALPVDTGPDQAEAGSIEEIAAATTEPRFGSAWVSYLPASVTVPSPRVFLHRIAGAQGELVNSTVAFAYSRALAAASPRVKLFTIGKSEEGREILMLAIADEAGIKKLGRLKDITRVLADPRLVDEAGAMRLIAEGRPIYYFNAGPHSDETGSTESVLELAYRLAVSEQPMIRKIRENMVVLLNPVSNPDGRDKQVEWFYTYLKGKTDKATLPRQAPPYWSKYTFVDINRDAHQQTHATTQAIHGMFHEWHPTVVHDLHEAVPLLMTWNGTGPYNPNIDPITYTEFLELSFHEVQAMTALGMPGVSTWNFGEGFSHLYSDSVAMNHNAIGRGYETYGNGTAETLNTQLQPEETSREWYRVSPPPKESFAWSARDTVNYNETGALAALDQVASHAKEFLTSFYRKGYHSWRAGLEHPPYAYLMTADQGDPLRVAALVSRLLAQRIEVKRTTSSLHLSDGDYPAGTYVVTLDQPYGRYAVDLLSPQEYPKDGGEPYDDVSWSLPAHYHLSVSTTTDPAVRAAPMDVLEHAPVIVGSVLGTGPWYVLRDTGQESLLEARFALHDVAIRVAEKSFRLNGVEYPAGSWIVPGNATTASKLAEVGQTLGLEFVASNTLPVVPQHVARTPRLGIWVPWADTDSIGWLRYALDQRHIPYTYVRDEDIHDGKRLEHLDVLLYGHVDLELAEQIHGIPKAWGPMAFRKTALTPSLGTPASSDDITGGIGWLGLQHVQGFIERGGLFVSLGSGSMLALEGGIVRGVRRDAGGVPRSTTGGGADAAAAAQGAVARTPGAHLRVSFAQPNHPIAYGYASRTHVFRQNFPLYATPRRWLRMAYCTTCLDGPTDASGVVMEWGDREGAPLVVSGQAWGESQLSGRPAIFDLPVGKGHVVAFNFNPLHRDLNRGDQRLVWNALINWEAIIGGKAQ